MHILSVRSYLIVYAVLLALLTLTVGVSFLPLGRVHLLAAMIIAIAKTVLIVLYFMHLRYGSSTIRLVAFVGLLWLALLIGLTLSDVKTRPWDQRRWISDSSRLDSTRNVPRRLALATRKQNLQLRRDRDAPGVGDQERKEERCGEAGV